VARTRRNKGYKLLHFDMTVFLEPGTKALWPEQLSAEESELSVTRGKSQSMLLVLKTEENERIIGT
jgi:hypothetical protein